MTDVPGLKIYKALADENRLRAAAALLKSELCVCQISELLDLAPSTVSKHMTILREAGVVDSQKRGRWVFYSISDDRPPGLPRAFFRRTLQPVADSDRGRRDLKRLTEILKIDPEILCERRRKC